MTSPPITPLERLKVSDGLLLTADRWQLAHAYHRQRQNLHYQSLNQAGIICGLGVSTMTAPEYISSQYRDRRWVQIQPGMAIDGIGNPIVVPQSVDYRITATPSQETTVVYLVVSYVDPDRLETPEQRDIVQETFRIDEKTTPPETTEVELCRIVLSPSEIQLDIPSNVFAPQINQLDLRHRQWVEAKPLAEVQVGQLCDPDSGSHVLHNSSVAASFRSLFESLPGLYPKLQGHPTLETIDINPDPNLDTITDQALEVIDLLYTPYDLFTQLDADAQDSCGQYLKAGGVIVMEIPTTMTALNEMAQVQYEMSEAVSILKDAQTQSTLRQELTAELNQLKATIDEEISQLIEPVLRFTDTVGLSAAGQGRLANSHPLRTHPFRFLRYPQFNRRPLEVLNWGGIVVIIGQLTPNWGADENTQLTRADLRSAQELGINLLHFAWQRRHYQACLRPQTTDSPKHLNLLNEIT